MKEIYLEERERLEQARIDLLNAKNQHLAAIWEIDEALNQTHLRKVANECSLAGLPSLIS